MNQITQFFNKSNSPIFNKRFKKKDIYLYDLRSKSMIKMDKIIQLYPAKNFREICRNKMEMNEIVKRKRAQKNSVSFSFSFFHRIFRFYILPASNDSEKLVR